MAQYAGESLAKKVARVRLYKRAREVLKYRLPSLREVRALFLIGPDAAEVGAIRHILGVRPENMVGVDRDQKAVGALKAREPNAQGVVGDLMDPEVFEAVKMFAEATDGYHFIHLDLMGNLPNHTAQIYGNYGNIVALDGVCGCTFLRGREPLRQQQDFLHTWAKECAEGQYSLGGPLKTIAADEERMSAHFLALQMGVMVRRLGELFMMSPEELKDPMNVFDRLFQLPYDTQRQIRRRIGRYYPVAGHAYRAETSPMGVLLAQRTLFGTWQTPEHYEKFLKASGRLVASVIKKDPMEDLLAEADSLQKEFTNEQVAEILDVSSGTLAAWRAHRTMGTYETT